jgi:hypothetical protein
LIDLNYHKLRRTGVSFVFRFGIDPNLFSVEKRATDWPRCAFSFSFEKVRAFSFLDKKRGPKGQLFVENNGFEPLTSWMQIKRSTSWANSPLLKKGLRAAFSSA